MKHLVPCLLLLPFITSCNAVQGEYYESGYYHPAPPRVEVHRFDERPPHHYGHRRPQANVHHGHSNQGSRAVMVTPHQPQARQQNVHGHGDNNARVIKHPSESGSQVVVHKNIEVPN